MWKLQYISVTRILREIKVYDYRGPKTAILTHFAFLRAKIYGMKNFRASEMLIIVVFEFLELQKLISHKI